MSERLKSMRRILAVQAQRKRLAEWALAASEGRRAAVAEARAALGGFIETASLAGPLAGLALRQGARLAEREALVEAECQKGRKALQAAERRHRLAERIADAAAAEDRTLRERRSLERLIEDAVGRGQASDAH